MIAILALGACHGPKVSAPGRPKVSLVPPGCRELNKPPATLGKAPPAAVYITVDKSGACTVRYGAESAGEPH